MTHSLPEHTDEARAGLRLAPGVAASLGDAWRQARGLEPCGYLLGARGAAPPRVVEVVPGRNVHRSPQGAFALAADEALDASRRARTRDLEVIGLWHGHLHGGPVPSHADRAGQLAPAPAWMLLVGRGEDGQPALRAWRRAADGAWSPAGLVSESAASVLSPLRPTPR